MASRNLSRLSVPLHWFLRHLRSGELSLLLAIFAVAGFMAMVLALFGSRVNQTLDGLSAEFLAADLVVASHDPLPDAWRTDAIHRGLAVAQVAEFNTVAAAGEQFQLTAVKAVSAGYPLRGVLRVGGGGAEHSVSAPRRGEIWVEQRLLDILELRIGEVIELGESALRVAGIVLHEPDVSRGFGALAPRIVMHLEDLPSTQLIQPSSRVHYRLLVAGSSGEIRALLAMLRPQLNADQRILHREDERPELGGVFDAATKTLHLGYAVLATLLGVAAALAARCYANRQIDAIAILRSLGGGRGTVYAVIGVSLLLTVLGAWIMGGVPGYFAERALAAYLRPLLAQSLAAPAWWSVPESIAMLAVLATGFVLPPLSVLLAVPPARILRDDWPPLATPIWAGIIGAIVAIGCLVWLVTGAGWFTGTLLGVGGTASAVLYALTLSSLRSARRWLPSTCPVAMRLAWRRLAANPPRAAAQILAFGLSVATALSVVAVSRTLNYTWQMQVGGEKPNFFALNIQPTELVAFGAALEALGLRLEQRYPVAPGRLAKINGQNPDPRLYVDGAASGLLRRDFSLTYTDQLPAGNQVVAGHWCEPPVSGTACISVEQGMAKALQLHIGDELSFSVDGQLVSGRVASIRQLRWSSLQPNFYVIFPTGILDRFPSHYLTSFYAAASAKRELIKLVRAFPAVTLIDVEALLTQVRALVTRLALLIAFVAGFAVVASILVALAAGRVATAERRYELWLLRALGGAAVDLQWSVYWEFAYIGLAGGLLAALLTEALIALMNIRFLQLPYDPINWMWLAAPAASLLLAALANITLPKLFGLVYARRVPLD